MADAPSNKIKQMLLNASVDFGADSFKIILMVSGFTFSTTDNEKYADVIVSELPTNYGYIRGSKILTGGSVTEDDVNNKGVVTWDDIGWNISGGTIITSGAIIYDDSITTPASEVDAIVGYIDFNRNQTIVDGGAFTVSNIAIRLS